MLLTNKKLLHEFYVEIGGDYPNLNMGQIKDVAFSAFKYLKTKIEDGELENVRLKYFGNFIVYPKRVQGLYNSLPGRLKSGKITKQKFTFFKNMLVKYLNKNNETFKRSI